MLYLPHTACHGQLQHVKSRSLLDLNSLGAYRGSALGNVLPMQHVARERASPNNQAFRAPAGKGLQAHRHTIASPQRSCPAWAPRRWGNPIAALRSRWMLQFHAAGSALHKHDGAHADASFLLQCDAPRHHSEDNHSSSIDFSRCNHRESLTSTLTAFGAAIA